MAKKREHRVERLEDRQLMAGDVSFSSGVLRVEMDAASPAEVDVGFVGRYVRVSGNVEFSPYSKDYVRSDQIQKIIVVGTNGADEIDLASVGPRQFPNLRGAEVHGLGGSDTIYGTRLHDVIYGGNGNDFVHGLEGKDVIRGGRGHDELYGGLGRDTLYGGPGNDYLWGAGYHADDKARDRIFGGRGYDTYGFRNHSIGHNDKLHAIENDLRSW
jgi:hypothetical protein